MNWMIDDSKTIKSVRHKTVRIIAAQHDAYRAFDVQMPLAADAQAYVAALDLEPYWAAGQEISEGSFIAARERQYRDYYYAILMSAYKTALASGDLDMARAAAFTAIATNTAKLDEFTRLRQTVGLSNLETTADKRDDLLWMGFFAVVGIISGG